ncbi:MAG: aminopeptidase P family protein [Rhodospirillaceae bacterium]|nr:aminopeptidase P family protein [Rhodospirillaceae bacterium]
MNAPAVADFSKEEFATRMARLRLAMRERGVGAMLLDDCEALNYFTGYDTSLNQYRACIVPLEGDPVMVLRALDAAPFLQQAWFGNHVGFADAGDPVDEVAAVFRSRGLGSAAIGFDPFSHALTVAGYERLRRGLPEARFVAMPRVPWELRLVKSPAEIARIAMASAILDRVMMDTIAEAGRGATPRGVTAAVSKRLLEAGCEVGPVGLISAARGWDFLHAALDDRPLERGDVLHLELVSRLRGYDARLMRCVSIGPADAARRQAAEALAALQDLQIAAMQPGALAREVDAVLRHGVIAAGLRPDYRNITGYTLGYYSKTSIRSSDFTRIFSPDAAWRLEPGMVFHMYTSAQGVAFSETVVVREDGAERLTRCARRLFEADAQGFA